ncbi:hypothetical protein [Ferrovibrio terrae]|uniref:hypothetical protein n=1 Tax=Ferrovibrio terrae TaxID=2594003 RepID=UPI003137C0F8
MARFSFVDAVIVTCLLAIPFYVLLVLLGPCARHNLMLMNVSSEAIDGLSVRMRSGSGEGEVWQGRLDRGQVRHLVFDWPSGDYTYRVSGRYESRGEDFALAYGYVSGMSDDAIVIADSGPAGIWLPDYPLPCGRGDVIGCVMGILAVTWPRELRCMVRQR